MKRKIKNIVIHCTGTDIKAKVDSIKSYWKDKLGWKRPGYHYIIDYLGNVHQLLAESKVSNGVKGHNSESLHISYIGGIDFEGKPYDTRSYAQELSMFDLIIKLSVKYPEATILGHRDFKGVSESCPSFDVKTWLKKFTPRFES